MDNAAILDEVSEGVQLGKNFEKRPVFLRVIIGIPLIYLPLLTTTPFVLVGVTIVRWHLWCLGAKNMKGYWDWIFNCKVYCPLSVALLRYAVYLVKIVENWWCPFTHERKEEYADGAIDYSYWHIYPETKALLHPDDRDNPIWNRDARK